MGPLEVIVFIVLGFVAGYVLGRVHGREVWESDLDAPSERHPEAGS